MHSIPDQKNDCRCAYMQLSLMFLPLNFHFAMPDILSIKCNYTYGPSLGELANLRFRRWELGGELNHITQRKKNAM